MWKWKWKGHLLVVFGVRRGLKFQYVILIGHGQVDHQDTNEQGVEKVSDGKQE